MARLTPSAHWKLNETSGTAIRDSAGANTGTWAGTAAQAITNTAGPLDNAILIDGGDPGSDTITVSADSSIDINGKSKYSISAWINPGSDGAGNLGRIVNKADANALSTGFSFNVRDEAASLMKLYWTVQHANTDMTSITDAAVIPINVWSHVVAVYNEDDDGEAKMYLNGALLATTDQAGDVIGAPSDDSGDELNIGNSSDVDRTFDGSISNVMIFNNVALSVAEVVRLYNDGHGVVSTAELEVPSSPRRSDLRHRYLP